MGQVGDETKGAPGEPARRPNPARERLAAALRENLKRRKAQARVRRAPAEGGGEAARQDAPCDPGATEADNDR